MTTQTQTTDQVLTDEQIEELNGAGGIAMMFWAFDNVLGLGLPWVIDDATGGHVMKACGSTKTI